MASLKKKKKRENRRLLPSVNKCYLLGNFVNIIISFDWCFAAAENRNRCRLITHTVLSGIKHARSGTHRKKASRILWQFAFHLFGLVWFDRFWLSFVKLRNHGRGAADDSSERSATIPDPSDQWKAPLCSKHWSQTKLEVSSKNKWTQNMWRVSFLH